MMSEQKHRTKMFARPVVTVPVFARTTWHSHYTKIDFVGDARVGTGYRKCCVSNLCNVASAEVWSSSPACADMLNKITWPVVEEYRQLRIVLPICSIIYIKLLHRPLKRYSYFVCRMLVASHGSSLVRSMLCTLNIKPLLKFATRRWHGLSNSGGGLQQLSR